MKVWLQELLKKIISNGFLLLLIISVFYNLYLRECKRSEPYPANNEIIISKATWDSILAVTNKPPEVRVDTFWKEKPTVTPNPQPPLPKPADDIGGFVTNEEKGINNYSDTLKNKEINVWVNYSIRGELLKRDWHYKPITITIKKDSIVYKPYPVEVDKPYPIATRGLFAYGIAGGNNFAFLFGGGLDYVTKKDTEVGYLYQRFGDQNFHSVKLGAKIKFKR